MIEMLALLAILFMALIGTPLFAVIAAIAMFGFYTIDIDLSVIAIEFYRITSTPMLMALPLFTFAGYLLSESQASKRLVNLTHAFLGWMPGGLAIIALFSCAFFTAFTGASGVTIVALGALLYPALQQQHYSEKFSLGLVTTSGSLGLLLPPSLPLILYGIIAQQLNIGPAIAITDLFKAGILPALLMIGLLSAWSIWVSRRGSGAYAKPKLNSTSFNVQRAKSALSAAAWEIPLPFLVLGGIYSGFFAVSEAAAVTTCYVLIVEVFIYKDISWTKLPALMRESMMMVGGILLILGVSLAFTNYLIDIELPMTLFETIKSHIDSKLTFLILLNILLLALGAILDIFSAIVIMTPIILPVAIAYGVHPVHLGIIFLANMQIGYFTPPVGMNLFIASYRFNKPITEIYRATLPFMVVLLVAVLIITYWPALSLVFVLS